MGQYGVRYSLRIMYSWFLHMIKFLILGTPADLEIEHELSSEDVTKIKEAVGSFQDLNGQINASDCQGN